jgi:hypothetical protein
MRWKMPSLDHLVPPLMRTRSSGSSIGIVVYLVSN